MLDMATYNEDMRRYRENVARKNSISMEISNLQHACNYDDYFYEDGSFRDRDKRPMYYERILSLKAELSRLAELTAYQPSPRELPNKPYIEKPIYIEKPTYYSRERIQRDEEEERRRREREIREEEEQRERAREAAKEKIKQERIAAEEQRQRAEQKRIEDTTKMIIEADTLLDTIKKQKYSLETINEAKKYIAEIMQLLNNKTYENCGIALGLMKEEREWHLNKNDTFKSALFNLTENRHNFIKQREETKKLAYELLGKIKNV